MDDWVGSKVIDYGVSQLSNNPIVSVPLSIATEAITNAFPEVGNTVGGAVRYGLGGGMDTFTFKDGSTVSDFDGGTHVFTESDTGKKTVFNYD
jgi:hypothetical protein